MIKILFIIAWGVAGLVLAYWGWTSFKFAAEQGHQI